MSRINPTRDQLWSTEELYVLAYDVHNRWWQADGLTSIDNDDDDDDNDKSSFLEIYLWKHYVDFINVFNVYNVTI